MGAFSFFSLSGQALTVAVLDTGFCPTLIKKNPKVRIFPVKDLSQSATYKCRKDILKKRQYHGHWVLSEILNKYDGINLEIYPMVIFNQRGEQKIRYWKRAFIEADRLAVDLIVAAAGLPIQNDDQRKEASLVRLPQAPVFLAAGRYSPGVPKDALLFPHTLLNKDKRKIFGSFHKGFESDGPHFEDTALIDKDDIDYYLPFNFRPRLNAELKGTSLAVALGAKAVLKSCKNERLKITDCLKSAKTKQTQLKNKTSKSQVLEMVP